MIKYFDAVDSFFDRYLSGVWGWVLTLIAIIVVIILERVTKSSTPMLLLAVPGLYMMGRSGGVVLLVKFGLCMAIVLLILAMAANQIPCGDGFWQGFRLFLGVQC